MTSELEVGSQVSTQGLNLAGGGYAMKVPVIDISEVGAGGGSIVAVDAGGSLQVGPRSAGAVPGPVCYGVGGTRPRSPTPTSSWAFSTRQYLAGGAVRLDAERARAAVEEQVARPLGTEPAGGRLGGARGRQRQHDRRHQGGLDPARP